MEQYGELEDLEVYKLAREFRNEIYKLIKKLPKEEKFVLGPQMRRAAISLTNNIAEGHGRYHYQENIQFCRQSRGSLIELFDDINIYFDRNYAEKSYLVLIEKVSFNADSRRLHADGRRLSRR